MFIGQAGTRYQFVERLGSGGQGAVYRVRSGEGEFALKWYRAGPHAEKQRRQIQTLIQRGSPGPEFIWPQDLVTHETQPGFGYVMPLIDTRRFSTINRILCGARPQPDLQALVMASLKLCDALDELHQRGYAYCDLSSNNLMLDSQSGEIVLFDNDNVVIDGQETAVMGTAEWMAPEVALNQSPPDQHSDLYSLALLLFHLWTWGHPMEGRATLQVRCWDMRAKRRFYAEAPVFCFDPNDRSNTAEGEEALQLVVKRWQLLCPTRLQHAFRRAFTEGVRDEGRRVRLSQWRDLFTEMLHNLMPCPGCQFINLIDPVQRPRACLKCGKPLGVQLVIRGHGALAVRPGASLLTYHLQGLGRRGEPEGVLGKVERHPQAAGACILRNNTQETWRYRVDGKDYPIEPQQARALFPAAEIEIAGRRLTVSELGPRPETARRPV